jgi:hypothetical protein
MESDDCRLSRLAVEAIMRVLNKRKGFDAWWEGVHSEAQKEIQHKMYLAVLDVARPIMTEKEWAAAEGSHG